MKVAPTFTSTQVLELHEELERDFPLGHPQREAKCVEAHMLFLRHAAALREARQIAPDARTVRGWARLFAMIVQAHQTGETNKRTLAKKVLGKSALTDGVEELAKAYGKLLREDPELVTETIADLINGANEAAS
jgi:hypothetical protein